MPDIIALISEGSTFRKVRATDRVVFPGDVLVEGDAIIRGEEEVDERETLMPVVVVPGVAGSGGEALRFDTKTDATGANPIMHGGWVQFGSQCWTGAASVFGAGIRLTPKIDTQVAGVPATYHLEIGDRTGVEKWRIDQDGYVTMQGNLDNRATIIANPAASAEALEITTHTAADGGTPIRNPGHVLWRGQCWTGVVNVAAPFMSQYGIIDTQAAGVAQTYHVEFRDRLGTEHWRLNEVGTVRTMQFSLGATHGATPAAETRGYELRNDTLSTVPAPMQSTSSLVWHGSAWDDTGAGAPQAQDWRAFAQSYSQAGWRGSRWRLETAMAGSNYFLAGSVDNYAYSATLGYLAATGLTTGMWNSLVGGMAGNHIVAAHQNTCVGGMAGMAADTTAMLALGYSAGRYETGDYKVFIDNRDRVTEARGRTESLLYGVTDAAVLSQTLAINAATTVNQPGLGATTTASGVSVVNATAAVAGPGVTVQVSPAYRRRGSAWNSVGGASETHDWIDWVLPVTAAGATTSTWKLQRSLNGAAYADMLTVDSVGTLTPTGDIVVANSTTAITSGAYKLNIAGGIAGGATDAVEIRSVNSLTAGGHILVLGNAAFDYGYVNYDGGFVQNGQGFGANEHDAFAATNITAASGATPVQMSGRVRWAGSAWNSGGAGSVETHEFRAHLLPVTSATLTTASLDWGYSFNGAAFANIMSLGAVVHNSVYGGCLAVYAPSLRAVVDDGLMLRNTQVAVTGDREQVSPAVTFESHVWDTDGFSDGHYCRVALVPDTPAATTLSKLSVFFRKDASEVAGAYGTALYTLSSNYRFTINNTGGIYYIGSVAAFQYIDAYFDGTNAATIRGASSSMNVVGIPADGATAVAVKLGHGSGLTVAGAKLASVYNNTTEKSYIYLNGAYTVPMTALGTTRDVATTNYPTAQDGILLINTTDAAAGAQQNSPSIRLEGRGWKTAATAASKAVSWSIYTAPVQGTSAPTARLYFDLLIDGVGGGTYSTGTYFDSGYVNWSGIRRGSGGMDISYGSMMGASAAGFYKASLGPCAIGSTLAESAGAVGAMIGTGHATPYALEGSRLATFNNYTDVRSNVDKDGVYYQAYGSGKFTSAAPLVRTLVTTCDDDTTYIIKWFAVVNDQAGSPAHNAAYECTAVYDRIDGTLLRRSGTVIELYDLAGDIAVVDTVSGNSVIVTFTTSTGAINLNGKVYGVQVMKCGSADLAAGVSYPLAA